MNSALRIIDASANRAREAMRVMEDAARFILDHRDLCAQIKSMRHDLAGALDALPRPGSELASRDTPGDVGTRITHPREVTRAGSRAAVVAAGKRLTEALRSIEEYAKAVGAGETAAIVEQVRYRAYDAERTLTLAMGTGRSRQWTLCVLVTESLCEHHSWLDVARLAIEGGADCIQLREKMMEGGELERRARALVELCRGHGASVIVNDRVDVALASGADGVHLGREDVSVKSARCIAGFELLIGVSTSSIEEARAALHAGADYCGVGAMFPTTTRHKDSISGPAYMREYAAHEPALPPHLAIGGITPRNVGEVVDAGARGVAVSSAVCAAEHPDEVCRTLARSLIDRHGAQATCAGV